MAGAAQARAAASSPATAPAGRAAGRVLRRGSRFGVFIADPLFGRIDGASACADADPASVMRHFAVWMLLASSGLLWAAQQGPPPPIEHTPEPAAPARLAPGDLVEVTVFETPELTTIARLDAQGTLQMPVIGAVPLAGATPSAASPRSCAPPAICWRRKCNCWSANTRACR